MSTEKTRRAHLRAEGRSYGMDLKRGMSSRDLDRTIQAKVSKDFGNGKCSACGKALHGGDCKK